MNIHGIGTIFARGRGIAALRNALGQGWVAPYQMEVPFLDGRPFLEYHVSDDILADRDILKKLRRADRLSKMSVLAAHDAMKDSGIEFSDPSRVGIILSTAFGPHETTFQFQDDILEYGDASSSPTVFSHSVHNAAASYMAIALGVRGPTLTLTQFDFSFHEALVLAEIWLDDDICDYVVVGNADECCTVMEYICSQKLALPHDGRITPFSFASPPANIPGEGAAIFVLSNESHQSAYCRISGVGVGNSTPAVDTYDLHLLDAGEMSADDTPYLSMTQPQQVSALSAPPDNTPAGITDLRDSPPSAPRFAAYSPIYGSMMIGSAFSLATAAIMLKDQTAFASPILDNPHKIPIVEETKPANLNKLLCSKFDCSGKRADIVVSR